MNIWETFINHSDEILEAIGGASVIATFTKTKWDNKILNWAAAAIQFAALNFKPAKAATQNKEVAIVTTAQKQAIKPSHNE